MRLLAILTVLVSIGAPAQTIFKLDVECDDCSYIVQTRKAGAPEFVQIIEETAVLQGTGTRDLFLPSGLMVAVIVTRSKRDALREGVRPTTISLVSKDKSNPQICSALGTSQVTLSMWVR